MKLLCFSLNGKKGDLTNSILGIVIAAICIALLVYAAILVYKSVASGEFNNARQVLNVVGGKIGAVKEGNNVTFLVQSPCSDSNNCNWFLIGWSKTSPGKPDRCYFDSCICACKGEIGNAQVVCQSLRTGICDKVSIDWINVSSYNTIKNYVFTPTPVPIYVPPVETKEWEKGIKLEKPLVALELNKGKSSAGVFYEESSA